VIPPSDNMGVTNPSNRVTTPPQASIDWLQYSVEWPPSLHAFPTGGASLNEVLKACLPPHDAFGLTGEIGYGGKGYTDSMQGTHARLFWHRQNRMQHIGVLMTGEDLRATLTIPYPHEALVRWCVARSKKIARIDFALDVFDPKSNPLDVLTLWKRGHVATPARTVQVFNTYTTSSDGVVIEAPTVYVGAANGDRRMRIYDKAKEQGVSGTWTRLELQLRDDRAWAFAKSCAIYGIERAGQQAIRDYVSIPKLNWWNNALIAELAYIEPSGRKETNTDVWIREVCFPAIERRAKEMIAVGEWTLYDECEKLLARLISDTNKKDGEK